MRAKVSRMSLAAATGIRIAVRAFRVDVDEAHLHGAERVLEVPVAGVALVVQPLGLGAPVDVLVRLPDVLAAAAEPEGLEAHGLQRDVAGEDHQVGPGDLPAVLLLDRPEQAARLVQADVVRPAVEGREALLAAAAAAAAVARAVGAGAVPGHADEQGPVVAEVRRPPVLRIGHERREVLLHGREVEALELLGVVEVLAHGSGPGGMLVQEVQPQLVRPPVTVRRAAAAGVIERALSFGLLAAHGGFLSRSLGKEASLALRSGPLARDVTRHSWPMRLERSNDLYWLQ